MFTKPIIIVGYIRTVKRDTPEICIQVFKNLTLFGTNILFLCCLSSHHTGEPLWLYYDLHIASEESSFIMLYPVEMYRLRFTFPVYVIGLGAVECDLSALWEI